ncbi:putative nuclear LIM interactor-interacting factor related [Monocercomonoides exilis]|uniref:putative nuclear LIM interactor-interacting factor related n=1 Tax=Monocercomonoides exilis TaxID=2049356 RepID=UPI00355AA67B|nr:putative nuclear LIM interactor-interacting factor related [Monocercomonoides exilis]|eukprot:MONOS_4164.1-p1 / transcript=MONOS_4164.1 / gene=MONOS_4164 / organism=Monocercomonoides_exilis_PA203 / gene_product=nuclear LIM interactor-interacting factor related / transcript_product=nuclear LIM interactor-interacting factor related / location=Mono_scaffold00107:13227-16525(-) / protein_length=1042 / sequence_SO=supercontig / SO=protein_coding / is_pseudo=false
MEVKKKTKRVRAPRKQLEKRDESSPLSPSFHIPKITNYFTPIRDFASLSNKDNASTETGAQAKTDGEWKDKRYFPHPAYEKYGLTELNIMSYPQPSVTPLLKKTKGRKQKASTKRSRAKNSKNTSKLVQSRATPTEQLGTKKTINALLHEDIEETGDEDADTALPLDIVEKELAKDFENKKSTDKKQTASMVHTTVFNPQRLFSPSSFQQNLQPDSNEEIPAITTSAKTSPKRKKTGSRKKKTASKSDEEDMASPVSSHEVKEYGNEAKRKSIKGEKDLSLAETCLEETILPDEFNGSLDELYSDEEPGSSDLVLSPLLSPYEATEATSSPPLSPPLSPPPFTQNESQKTKAKKSPKSRRSRSRRSSSSRSPVRSSQETAKLPTVTPPSSEPASPSLPSPSSPSLPLPLPLVKRPSVVRLSVDEESATFCAMADEVPAVEKQTMQQQQQQQSQPQRKKKVPLIKQDLDALSEEKQFEYYDKLLTFDEEEDIEDIEGEGSAMDEAFAQENSNVQQQTDNQNKTMVSSSSVVPNTFSSSAVDAQKQASLLQNSATSAASAAAAAVSTPQRQTRSSSVSSVLSPPLSPSNTSSAGGFTTMKKSLFSKLFPKGKMQQQQQQQQVSQSSQSSQSTAHAENTNGNYASVLQRRQPSPSSFITQVSQSRASSPVPRIPSPVVVSSVNSPSIAAPSISVQPPASPAVSASSLSFDKSATSLTSQTSASASSSSSSSSSSSTPLFSDEFDSLEVTRNDFHIEFPPMPDLSDPTIPELQEHESNDYFSMALFPDVSMVPAPQPRLPPPSDVVKRQNRNYLVLDLDETLVHCEYTTADRAVKRSRRKFDASFSVTIDKVQFLIDAMFRPGLMQFLDEVSEMYEVIVFTASKTEYASALLDIIEQGKHRIHHRLYRDACFCCSGNFIKDLRVLNRDLSRVIMMDNSPQAFVLQIENGFVIKSFFGEQDDNELIESLGFLRFLAQERDVRPWLTRSFHIQAIVDTIRKRINERKRNENQWSQQVATKKLQRTSSQVGLKTLHGVPKRRFGQAIT